MMVSMHGKHCTFSLGDGWSCGPGCDVPYGDGPYDAARVAVATQPEPRWFYMRWRDESTTAWSGPHNSRDDAIAAGRIYQGPDRAFQVICGAAPDPARFVPSAGTIAGMMNSEAIDNSVSLHVGNWPYLTDEARAKLDDMLKAWARRHCPVDWWESIGEPEDVR